MGDRGGPALSLPTILIGGFFVFVAFTGIKLGRIPGSYPVGATVRVYYDPADPQERPVSLVRVAGQGNERAGFHLKSAVSGPGGG